MDLNGHIWIHLAHPKCSTLDFQATAVPQPCCNSPSFAAFGPPRKTGRCISEGPKWSLIYLHSFSQKGAWDGLAILFVCADFWRSWFYGAEMVEWLKSGKFPNVLYTDHFQHRLSTLDGMEPRDGSSNLRARCARAPVLATLEALSTLTFRITSTSHPQRAELLHFWGSKYLKVPGWSGRKWRAVDIRRSESLYSYTGRERTIQHPGTVDIIWLVVWILFYFPIYIYIYLCVYIYIFMCIYIYRKSSSQVTKIIQRDWNHQPYI